jgi:hypothetical protein
LPDRQGAERLAAFAATIALQPIGVTIPDLAHGITVWACRATGEAPVDYRRRNRPGIQRRQLRRHLLTPVRRQYPQRSGDSIQVGLLYEQILHDPAHSRQPMQYPHP